GIAQDAELNARLMMEREGIFCSGCGITLRPFMRVCPRCGAKREEPTSMLKPPPASMSAPAPPETYRANFQVPVVPTSKGGAPVGGAIGGAIEGGIRGVRYSTPARNAVLLSPEEARSICPLFTAAQWTMIAIGAGLLVMMLVIAYLLWRQQQRDTTQSANRNVVAVQPSPNASATTEPSPTPSPSDDQAIYESVKTQLTAYNPSGFSRYSFEVTDGRVTINGEAGHQPEKEGVGNVLKLISGVKSVVNNLKVKPEGPGAPNESLAPVKLNLAEAKILDDALRREFESSGQAA